HHTSFTVANLERSLAFFRDVLGLEVLGTREIRDEYFGRIVGLPGSVVKAAMIRLPGGHHHLELFEYVQPRAQESLAARPTPRRCDPGSCHLALLTSDLPALYEKLVASGVHFLSAPVLVTAGPNRGGQGAYLRDPNGILIELFQPPPAPEKP